MRNSLLYAEASQEISNGFHFLPAFQILEIFVKSFLLRARLPDVTGTAAGCFGVAVFPRALRDRARAVGEQLVPEIAGETSRAVW